MEIGRQQALAALGLADQDWGPAYDDVWPYETFAQHWRGEKPCPTAQALADAVAALTPAGAEVEAANNP